MSQISRVLLRYSPEKLSRIQAAIDVLETELMPDLVTLASSQRQEILKMGDKSVSYVRKSLEYMRIYPDLLSGFINVAEVEADFGDSEMLRALGQRLRPILVAIDDTQMISGSQAFQGCLLFYRNVHAASAAQATPHATTVYEDLSKRFPGAPRKTKNGPSTE